MKTPLTLHYEYDAFAFNNQKCDAASSYSELS